MTGLILIAGTPLSLIHMTIGFERAFRRHGICDVTHVHVRACMCVAILEAPRRREELIRGESASNRGFARNANRPHWSTALPPDIRAFFDYWPPYRLTCLLNAILRGDYLKNRSTRHQPRLPWQKGNAADRRVAISSIE